MLEGMRVAIVYESMYGNTRRVAEAVGAGVRRADADAEVQLVPVHEAAQIAPDGVDLLVLGAPTHAWGLPRTNTRHGAAEASQRGHGEPPLEPFAESPGVREWLEAVPPMQVAAATFDTRRDAPAALTGRAAKVIGKRLRAKGARLVAAPESFLVTKDNHLVSGELDRAHTWGEHLLDGTDGRPT